VLKKLGRGSHRPWREAARREIITLGRLQGAGVRVTQDIAETVLTHRKHKLRRPLLPGT